MPLSQAQFGNGLIYCKFDKYQIFVFLNLPLTAIVLVMLIFVFNSNHEKLSASLSK